MSKNPLALGVFYSILLSLLIKKNNLKWNIENNFNSDIY